MQKIIALVVMIGVLSMVPMAHGMMCGKAQCVVQKPIQNLDNVTNHGVPISDDPYTNMYSWMLQDLDKIVAELGQLIIAENQNTAELKKICLLQGNPSQC